MKRAAGVPGTFAVFAVFARLAVLVRLAVFAVFALFAPRVAGAEPRKLTVENMVELALAENPALGAARARAHASTDLGRSAFGRLLPSVRLTDEYQHWDSPFAIPFGGVTFKARDQDTNTFSATADQPLLGLGRLVENRRAQHALAGAADAQARTAEAELRESIETEYLRLFQARALEEIAHASERELGEQVTIAAAKLKAGVLTTADLLRVRVAAANARQQAIVARTEAEIARITLLTAIGIAPDAEVELLEPATLLSAAEAPREKLAERDGETRALAHRPEVDQARLVAAAAGHQRGAARWALLPDLDAEGGYVRVDGQVFAPKDQAFIGVRASWAIWDWGASWFASGAAKAQAEAAELDVESARRRVRVQVASRLALAESAASAVALARETIVAAEEAYRITDAQLKAGTATTTDLLDAEAALTQARLSLTRARYEQASTRVSLVRALGD